MIDNVNEDGKKHTWAVKYGSYAANTSGVDLYVVSMYWCITTITTVGFGDITADNNLERVFSILIMLIGVFGFSFMNGTMASLFTSMDSNDVEINKRQEIAERIIRKHKIPRDMKKRILKEMGQVITNDYSET